MPTGGVRNEGKSQFVKEQLKRDPKANTHKINLAWSNAGKDGEISATLVNKLRSALGYAGNLRKSRKARGVVQVAVVGRRGRKPKASPVVAVAPREPVTAARAEAPARGIDSVEADIDRLLFKVMSIEGMAAVESELRQARRELYRALDE